MPNIKKHRYASMLLSRFFNMRLSNHGFISKPLDAFIESTCSHTQKKNGMQSTTPYEPNSVSPNTASPDRPTTNPHTGAYSERPYVTAMFRNIRQIGDMTLIAISRNTQILLRLKDTKYYIVSTQAATLIFLPTGTRAW